jgi:hypothetical protein
MTISIKSPTSTTGSIQKNGSDVLTIDSSDNVTVVNNLSVSGTVSSTGAITFDGGVSGNVNFDSGTLYVDATNNRVGIGTSSPTNNLQIYNSGATSGQIHITNSSTGATATDGVLFGYDGSNDVLINNQEATAMKFNNNGSERMRIDSSGNVLVNSTSNVTFGSGAKLSVQGSGTGLAVGYGTATAQYRIMYMNSGDSALYFHNNSNYAYLNSAGAWTNASDERLKNNIVDIKYGLDAVLNTQPRSYKMNDVEGDFIGFVAQELQTVIPEVVSGDPEIQLGVDYGSLVTVAFKAIQELKAENDTLKSQLLALETRIEALENPNG